MLTWHTLMPKCTISWSIVKSAASGKLLQFLDRQSALITQGAKQLRSSRLLVTARNTEAFDEHLGVMQLHSVFLLSALGSWMPKVQNKHWRCTTDCQHPTLTLVCKSIGCGCIPKIGSSLSGKPPDGWARYITRTQQGNTTKLASLHVPWWGELLHRLRKANRYLTTVCMIETVWMG